MTPNEKKRSAFPQRLNEALENSHHTMGSLAAETDISRQAIREYMTGRMDPTLGRVLRLAKALNISVAELVSQKGARK